MKKINATSILIVDDHKMVRDGIYHMLKTYPENKSLVIEQAGDRTEALLALKINSFEVIIMDYQLPKVNGADLTKEVLKLYPRVKILALSNSDEMLTIKQMIKSGANGFVLKNIAPSELILAINSILDNQMYYSHEIALKLLASQEKTKTKVVGTKAPPEEILTKTQKIIIDLIALGLSNELIADQLSTSKRTIESHKYNIMQKLRITSTRELLKYAVQAQK